MTTKTPNGIKKNTNQEPNPAQDLDILYRVSSGIHNAQDEQSVLDAIVDVVGDISSAIDRVTITLWHAYSFEGADTIRIAADWQRSGAPLHTGTVLPIEFLSTVTLMDRNQVRFSNDVKNDPSITQAEAQTLETIDTGSFIYAPLTIGTRWLGTINFSSVNAFPFTKREMQLVEAIARFAADAIERTRLQLESNRYINEMQTVSDVSSATASNVDINSLLKDISNRTRESFNLYHAQIYLYDEAEEALVLTAGAGDVGDKLVARHHSIPVTHPHSLVAGAARDRHGIISNDITRDVDHLPNPLLPDTRSEMTVPMIVGDTLIGVLDVQSELVNRFDTSDMRVKTTLGSQIAIAVQNTRQYQSIQQSSNRTAIAASINLALSLATNEDEIMAALGQLAQIEGMQIASMSYIDEDDNGNPAIIEVKAVVDGNNDPVPLSALPATRLPAETYPFIDLILDSPNQILFVEDFNNDPRIDDQIRAFTTQLNMGSGIIVPLRSATEWVGMVVYAWAEPRTFDQGQRDLFELLRANILAIISNRRQYVATQVAQSAAASQSKRLEQAAEIATTVSNILDMETMLQTAVELTKVKFNRYHAHIYLLDDTGHYLQLVAGAGNAGRKMLEHGHSIALDHENSLVARAARTRDAQIVNDVSLNKNFLPNPLLPDTKSELALPMVVGNWLVGVMDIQDSVVNAFDEADASIKTTLASQIGVAVENARAVALTQTQAEFALLQSERLQQVADIATQVSNILQEDSLLQTAVELTKEKYNRYHAQIYLLDEAGETLVLAAGAGDIGRRLLDRGHSIPLDRENSLVAHAARDRMPIRENDVRSNPEFLPNPSLPLTRSELAIPMIVGDRVVGVMDIQDDRVDAFDEADASIKTTLASQIGVAVENARTLKDVEFQSERLQKVADIATQVSNTLDEQELLQTAVELTKEKYNRYHAQIYLLDEAGETLVLAAGAGDIGRRLLDRGHSIPLDRENSLVARAAREKLAIRENDVRSNPDFLPNPSLPLTRSELAIPMVVGERLVGVMDIQDDRVDAFDEADASIKTTLASQIGVAVENARTLKDVEFQSERLQKVADIATQVSNTLDEQELLQAAVELTKEKYNRYHAHIYLMDEIGENLVLAAGAGDIGRRLLDRGHSIPLNRENSLVARAAREKLAIRENDVRSNPSFLPNPSLPLTRSELAIPMVVGDRVVGVLDIQDDRVNAFDEADASIKTALASQIGVAVENARAVALTQRQVEFAIFQTERLQKVADIATQVSNILDEQELLQTAVELTKEKYNRYHAHIYLMDEVGENLVLAAGAGDIGRRLLDRGHSIPLDRENSLVARAAREKLPIRENDVRSNPDFLPNPSLPLTRSELAIPMVVGDRVVGVMDVQDNFIDAFDEADGSINATLASQIGVAIENARAVQLTKEQAERERETAERLREVDRLKSQFLANMSHELRTPLNSIIGYSEILLDGDDGELSEDAHEDVETIHQSGHHLLSLINDILDLAKIEAGEMSMDRRMTNLDKVAHEVVTTAGVLVREKDVTLKIDYDPNMPQLYVDPIRMRQIIMNLVSNAIKFTEHGSVTIKIGTLNENEAHISVIDTGMGISNEHLDAIFEQFQQVDGSSTRRAGGTGLGLTITRYLVHMHGGEIRVESEIGVGSTFRVTLPITEQVTA